MAEIGVFHGKVLIGLAMALRPGERVVAVDVFDCGGVDFEAAFRANVERFAIPAGKLVVRRGDSADLTTGQWREMLGGPARLVHVDGDHSCLAALTDLDLAASCLSPDGVMVVDDVFNPYHPGVTEAAASFLERREDLAAIALVDRSGPLATGGPKLIIAPRGARERYQAALRQCLGHHVMGVENYYGSPMLILGFEPMVMKTTLVPTG